METLLYLAKVNMYWILFYFTYRLLLHNHTFFHWNRFYLLGSLLIAFALPLITIPESVTASQTAIYAVSGLPVYISKPESVFVFSDWTHILFGVLAMGCVYLLFHFIKSIQELMRLASNSDAVDIDGIKLVLLPHSEVGSFSFFKWLVMNRLDYEQNFEPILRHESVHIRQMHSLDIILIEILKILFWFNPVLWFYKRSMQEIHEFLADEHAPDRDGYARFLVAYAFNAPAASLTNHFFNGPLLKSRIKMIYKNRNAEWMRSKYFIILPLVCVVIMMTAARERVLESFESQTPIDTPPAIEPEKQTSDLVTIASPKAGAKAAKATSKVIDQQPKEFKANSLQAKTYNFTSQDSVPASNKKTYFSNYRYVQPGSPIKVDSFPNIGTTITLRGYSGPGSEALIIIDGVKQEKRGAAGYEHINRERIESINILKNQSAIESFGAEATDGVIMINTKK